MERKGSLVHFRQKAAESGQPARTSIQVPRTQPFNHVVKPMRSPSPTSSVKPPVAVSTPELLSPGVAHLLAEVGFLALDQKDWSRANQIFSVLMAFRSQSEFPYVGMVLIEFLQSRWEAAAHWARLGLAQVPGSRALAQLEEGAMREGVIP